MRVLQRLGAKCAHMFTLMIWFQIWYFFHPHQGMPPEIFLCVCVFCAFGLYLLTKAIDNFRF